MEGPGGHWGRQRWFVPGEAVVIFTSAAVMMPRVGTVQRELTLLVTQLLDYRNRESAAPVVRGWSMLEYSAALITPASRILDYKEIL